MMGMEEDPEDNAAVAASVFIAVAVYGVSCAIFREENVRELTTSRDS